MSNETEFTALVHRMSELAQAKAHLVKAQAIIKLLLDPRSSRSMKTRSAMLDTILEIDRFLSPDTKTDV